MKKALISCPPRTAVAYARYSSAGQRDVSIDQQLRDIHAYAEREGYTIVHEFADHARSGFTKLSARSEFLSMISSASEGTFDTILCWKVDRFGRSRADSTIIKRELRELGVSVVYVMEPIPEGAAGVLTEGMLETFAEWYSRNLSENIVRGLNDNARHGLYNGARALGYGRGSDGRYAIVPEEAAIIRLIFSRYIAGYSLKAISRELNSQGINSLRGTPFCPGTILRIINNERYAGVYIWNDIRIPDCIPPIVSHSDWEKAQEMRKKKGRHIEKKQTTTDYLLTGKAFCGHCGRYMVGTSGTSRSGNKYCYYICHGRYSHSGCDNKIYRKDVLEDFVINFVLENCLTEPMIEKIADVIMAELSERAKKSPLASMESELSDMETQIHNINKAIASGIYSKSTAQMLSELEKNADSLRSHINFLRAQETQLADRDRILFFLHRFSKLDVNNPVHRKKLIDTFINAVYVYNDHLKIVVNAIEGSSRIPLESLPDISLCSDSVSSGLLIMTHPNRVVYWFIAKI